MRSTFAVTAAAVAALFLSGCISESADVGHPPPVVLETPRSPLALPASASRSAEARAAVRRAIVEIGDGDIQAVRVRIYARSPRDGDGIRRMLVGLGADPARLTLEPGRSPANRLILTRAIAETAPCANAISPADPDDPLPSLMSLARCTQDNNLSHMLVDPGDLVAPPPLSAEDGEFLVDGVRSWRKNRATGLPSQDTSGSASSGFGGGGSPVASTGSTTAQSPSGAPTASGASPAPQQGS